MSESSPAVASSSSSIHFDVATNDATWYIRGAIRSGPIERTSLPSYPPTPSPWFRLPDSAFSLRQQFTGFMRFLKSYVVVRIFEVSGRSKNTSPCHIVQPCSMSQSPPTEGVESQLGRKLLNSFESASPFIFSTEVDHNSSNRNGYRKATSAQQASIPFGSKDIQNHQITDEMLYTSSLRVPALKRQKQLYIDSLH